ncbi:MAG: triose-phosphate isomerase [Streptosporangiaceae bacterium]
MSAAGSGRKPLVAGNWKMNTNHFEALALTQKLAFRLTDKDFAAADIALLPPFTALRSVQSLVQGDKLKLQYGAQDLSPHPDGAYTGDISGGMLAKLGCQYVLAGHSERRQYHFESDELVNAKVKAAFGYELTPVLCVGEPLEVREEGRQLEHTLRQVDGGLDGLSGPQIGGMVIAYEPIWAIGTGKVATPQDAQEVCGAIRERVSARHGHEAGAGLRILYGGSVKPDNMPAIMAQSDIDGALVGGASLDHEGFVRICRYRDALTSA